MGKSYANERPFRSAAIHVFNNHINIIEITILTLQQ